MSTNEAAVPAGLPDPSVLARMANEFFTGVSSVESVTDAAPSFPAAPLAAPPASVIPSLPSTAPAAGVPAFSFLKDVRPLFPEIEAPPAAASPFAPLRRY